VAWHSGSTAHVQATEKGEAPEQALERCRYSRGAGDAEQYRGPSATDAAGGADDAIIRRRSTAVRTKDADFLERAHCRQRGLGRDHVLTEFIGGGEVPMPVSRLRADHRMFDPMVRETEADKAGTARALCEEAWDRRWIRVRRPGLIVGGEFTEESLELGYDPITRFYQAPKHLKAQGGVLVVDDFGRQKVAPTDMLNRWIMALERGRDNLLLRTESIDVPFHITILFSTNPNLSDLAGPGLPAARKSYTAPSGSVRQHAGVVESVGCRWSRRSGGRGVPGQGHGMMSGSLARDLDDRVRQR
jgi:hypothetical protein